MLHSKEKRPARLRAETVSDHATLPIQRGTLNLGTHQVAIDAATVYVGRGEGCTLPVADRKVSSMYLELAATERGVRCS